MESEGRDTSADDRNGRPDSNVISLRDWFGPEDELVPLGPRARANERESAAADGPGHASLTAHAPQPPPSPEDFWGERSAAVHDAVQAPAAHGNAARRGRRTTNRALGTLRRPGVAAAIAATAIAVAAIIVIASNGLGTGGSAAHIAGGQRVGAAVLSAGVSRLLKLRLPQIEVSAAPSRPRAVKHAPRKPTRRRSHPQLVAKAVHHSSPPTQPGSYSSAPTYAAQETPVSSTTPYHSSGGGTSYSSSVPTPTTSGISSSPPASRSSSTSSSTNSTKRRSPSGATVSPTGESGALGPVHSPNG